FDSLTWLLPSTSVDHQTNQDNPPPSLQPHYRTFIATTRRSAPLPRIGTLPLADSAAWGSPLRRPRQHAAGHIRARGSHVPHRSLNRDRATSAPDTHLASKQAPARLFPGQQLDPGFDDTATLSTLHQWFTHVRLLSSHLTHHVRLFRNAHHHGSFTAAACGGLRPPPARAVPEGLPPSPVQHRIQKNSVYIGTSLSVRGTPSSANHLISASPSKALLAAMQPWTGAGRVVVTDPFSRWQDHRRGSLGGESSHRCGTGAEAEPRLTLPAGQGPQWSDARGPEHRGLL